MLNEGLRVFGGRVATGVSAPWGTDPLTGRQWPTDDPWWRIDIRSEARLSDVKYTWEAGRHRDLVVLARAARLDPVGPWQDGLTGLLRAWCAESPPEQGVNWYSSLELALRAIAWNQILALVGDRLPRDVVTAMERLLLSSARHLMVELPYTVSSMRNNHLLGDALGLILLARMFPTARRARWWARTGEKMFAAQQRRHFGPDGRMIEDSVSYHRFVLEMLVVRVLLGGAPSSVRDALRAASLHLARLGVFDGDVPQYGDWDEGRVLASSGDALDVAGSAALGLALCGERLPARWYADFDELAWYAPTPDREATAEQFTPPTHTRPGATTSGGIALVDRGPWRVWFKVDGGPSHGHADLTSVWVKHGGRWLIADPGTGTYNGPLEVRNGLRTSAAHPVRRPDGRDQLVPHRAFRWLNTGRGHLGAPLVLPDRTIVFGWHDAYARGEHPVRVGRAVVVADRYVAIVEFADPPAAAASWSLTVPLHPEVAARGDAHRRRNQGRPLRPGRVPGGARPVGAVRGLAQRDVRALGAGDVDHGREPGRHRRLGARRATRATARPERTRRTRLPGDLERRRRLPHRHRPRIRGSPPRASAAMTTRRVLVLNHFAVPRVIPAAPGTSSCSADCPAGHT
ncbi:hypothetical protein GCM10027614_73840 [Micromonospora vulcania]